MSVTITREQLYELVWSEAMQKLARQIGISDVAIAKHCRKVGVPVPERGYWNKLQAGKKAVRTPLPPADLGTVRWVEMSGNLTPELRTRFNGRPGAHTDEQDSIEILTERFRRRLGIVRVPRSFAPVHPLVAKVLAKDEERRRKMETERYYWQKPLFDSPFERRRLLTINGLFLGLAKVGGDGSWLRGEDARDHGLTLGGTGLSFTLDPPNHRPDRGRLAVSPDKSEKLRLTLSHLKPALGVAVVWTDDDSGRLEDRMAEVIVGIGVAAEHARRQWAAERMAWEQQRREEAERAEIKRREEAERRERERRAALAKARTDELLADAEAFRRAAEIRAYVDAVLAAAPQSDDAIVRWAAWAREEAERLDPIASGRAFAQPDADEEADTTSGAR